uniref:Head-to-tail stopper n=1 Tax=Mycolicibacterium phage Caroline1 TaxID=3240804 RepID=A0AB39U2J1_9CAUD
MSLLRRGTETVTVYPEVTVTDSDGNKFTRPGSVGIVVKASVQPLGLLGAPAENTDGGFNTQSRYRMANRRRHSGGSGTGRMARQAVLDRRRCPVAHRQPQDRPRGLHDGSELTAPTR